MNWWVSTDWHIDHANILTYEGRPENHTELLVQRHNEKMTKDDGLICLGDTVFGMTKEESLRRVLGALNARTIILCRGNHDKFPTEWYLDMGFDIVCDQIVMKGVLFSHHPAQLGIDHLLNVHGHHHRGLHRDDEKHWYPSTERHILLSCGYTDYYPISLGDLKNGRYTYNNVVYYTEGCTNGHEAYLAHHSQNSGVSGHSGEPQL